MTVSTTFTLRDNASSKIENIINKVNKLSKSVVGLNYKVNDNRITNEMDKISGNLTKLSMYSETTNKSFDKMFNKLENPPNPDPQNKVRGWLSKIQKIAETAFGIYITVKGLKYAFNLSDNIINIDARLNFITNSEDEKVKMKNTMMKVANELGTDYLSFSDQVIKMKSLTGDTFGSNSEVIRFNELLAKSFKISGTNSESASAAMYQLTQAMASGRLQGDEFRSTIENAPLLARAIADEMGVSFDKIKKLSSEGKITSDIIKSALFNMSDELDNKFSKLPRTWGQLTSLIKNKLIKMSEKILNTFNKIASSDLIIRLVTNMSIVFGLVIETINVVANIISNLITNIVALWDSFEFLRVVITNVAIALGVYKGLMVAITLYMSLLTVATKGWAIAKTFLSGVISVFNGKISLMNLLLNLNPIGLVVAGIVAFITILQGAITIVNKFTGTTKTLLGVIVGAVYGAFAIIGNVAIGMVNVVIKAVNHIIWAGATIGEAVYNMFVSPLDAVKNYVVSVINFVLGGIKKLASVADKIAGTNMAGSISKIQENLEGKKVYTKGMVKWSQNTPKINEFGYFNVKNAWNKGNSVGDDMQSKLSNMFSDDSKNLLKDMDNKLGNIDNNTEKGANSTKEFVEDLKLLRDMAHREYIAEVTTPVINVEIKNNNHINTDEDKQDFIQTLTNQVSLAVLGGARKGVIR